MSIGLERTCFTEVCTNEPERDETGEVHDFLSQNEYADEKQKELHDYGHVLFCQFRIPAGYQGKTGVYAILSDDELCYVGECEDASEERECYG